MTQGEIKSSYRQLENMIEIMRNCLLTDKQAEAKLDAKAFKRRRGWKEILDEKKWGNKKVKEIIASLETIRDKIQDPIPSGIGDLKLRGSKLSDSFPKGEKKWADWVLEVANEFYQDFSKKATKAKMETMIQFLTRVKGSKKNWEGTLSDFTPTPEDPKFQEKFSKLSIAIPDLPSSYITSAAKFFGISAGRTGAKEKVKVKTRRGSLEIADASKHSDWTSVFTDEEVGQIEQEWDAKAAKKDRAAYIEKLKKKIAERKRKRSVAEKKRKVKLLSGELEAEEKDREMRRDKKVAFTDTREEDRLATLSGDWQVNLENNLDQRNFKFLITELGPTFNNEPLDKFKGIGIEVLYDILYGSAIADVAALVQSIDYHRKGIDYEKQIRADLTLFKESYINNEIKSNKSEPEFELHGETLLGEDRLNELRSLSYSMEADEDDKEALSDHLEAKHKIRNFLGKEVSNQRGDIYKQYQNYVRQIQDVKAKIAEYKDDDDYKDRARALLEQKVDLDSKPVWQAWGFTDDELTSDEVIKAFNLTDDFEKGVFATMFFQYHKLGEDDWKKFFYKWLPVDEELSFRPYYPTGRITETTKSDTFPESFKALLSYVRLFTKGKTKLKQYEVILSRMMDDFSENVKAAILMEERDPSNDRHRRRVMEGMVEDNKGDDGLSGKEHFLEKHPEGQKFYTSKLGIGDDLTALSTFMGQVVDILPALLLTELKKSLVKVANNEGKTRGKQIRVSYKGKSMTLKEKLVDLGILEWGEDE
jgi:hypothetical protein